MKEAPSSAREASMGSAIRLAAEIVVRVSSVVATLWLTRSLGVSTFGVFVIALSLGLMIAELCDLGLNAIAVPLIVRSGRNLRALVVLKAAMTLAVLVFCGLLIPLASAVSGLRPSLLSLCTIHFLGVSWIGMAGMALRALGRRIDEALLLLAFRFTLVGLVIGAPFGATVSGVSLAYAVAVLPALGLGWALLRASPSPSSGEVPDNRSILRQAMPLGMNGYLAILSTRVELFLLQAFQGAHAAGLFGGALRIIESLLTLPSAIAAGALPSVVGDAVKGSRGAAQRMFGLVVWMGVPSAIGLALCAPGVLLVLGPDFVEGAPALRILSASLFLCFGNAALFHVLIASGNTSIIPRLTFMRVGIAALLGMLLVPGFGLSGAAVSFTAAEFCLFAALVREAGGQVELMVLRPLGWALLACVPMAVVLSLWPMSLSAGILLGALSFGVSAGTILRRGTHACGLA